MTTLLVSGKRLFKIGSSFIGVLLCFLLLPLNALSDSASNERFARSADSKVNAISAGLEMSDQLFLAVLIGIIGFLFIAVNLVIFRYRK